MSGEYKSRFDALKDYQSATADQKLAIVAHELIREIAIVNGYATVLDKAVQENELNNIVPSEWKEWIEKIILASNDMTEILNIVTSTGK